MKKRDESGEVTREVREWIERNEVLSLIDRIRDEQKAFERYAAHVIIEPDHAASLVADLSTVPMGTEAMITPSYAVEIKFDRRQVFAVAIYIVGHGGMYDGRS